MRTKLTITTSSSGLSGHQWNIPVESNLLGSSPGVSGSVEGTGEAASLRFKLVPPSSEVLLALVGLQEGRHVVEVGRKLPYQTAVMLNNSMLLMVSKSKRQLCFKGESKSYATFSDYIHGWDTRNGLHVASMWDH